MTSKTDLEKLGTAQAALLAAMLGILTLSLAHLGSELSVSFKNLMLNVGKAWIPSAEGIGPYSGKETLALGVWLLSWFVLDRLLKTKEWNHPLVLVLFLVGIATATTLLWPPVTHRVVHLLTGAKGG